MADEIYDVVVIGGGPGGYVAALHAGRRGLRTACIDAAQLGGVCNNVGCIPTKALLESAAYAAKIERLADMGITVSGVDRDLARAATRARKVADQGARGISYLFRKHGVEHVHGWARCAAPLPTGHHRVLVGPRSAQIAGNPIGLVDAVAERELITRHVIVATGSRAKALGMLPFDGDRIWSSDEAVYPPSIPKTLAIIGAGAVGMEFADVYASFGTHVTIVEAFERVLAMEDEEIAAVVDKSFVKRGIVVHLGARLTGAEVRADGVKLAVSVRDTSLEIDAERVLVAIGRAPAIEGLGLEELGVQIERGFVVTDERLCTNIPGICAVGDVTRPPLLAHKAWAEAAVAVRAIAREPLVAVDYGNIPNVTYCHPEVASVGMTEAAARAAGKSITIGRFPWSANGRARGSGETEGVVKVIRDDSDDRILGAHIVGPHASELITQFVIARLKHATVEELEFAVAPHPTLSDSLPEAALAAIDRAVHI